MIKFLLFAILTVLCWPLGLLIAAVWIPCKLLAFTGKATTKSAGLGVRGLGALTANIKPKDHWHSIDTPVGLLEKRKSA